MLLCPMSSPQMMTMLGFLSAANAGGPVRNRNMTIPHSARDRFRFRMSDLLTVCVVCFYVYASMCAIYILTATRRNMSHIEVDSFY